MVVIFVNGVELPILSFLKETISYSTFQKPPKLQTMLPWAEFMPS